MVPPASHRISRVPRYSGSCSLSSPSPTGLSPSLDPLSSGFGSVIFGYSSPQPRPSVDRRFGLFPLRSPLLRKSSFLSSPPGTEMFHFPGCPPVRLWIHLTVTGHYPGRVPPFGYPWINAYLQLPMAFRSLSRPSSAISALASTLRSYSLDLASPPSPFLRLLRWRCLLLICEFSFLRF